MLLQHGQMFSCGIDYYLDAIVAIRARYYEKIRKHTLLFLLFSSDLMVLRYHITCAT